MKQAGSARLVSEPSAFEHSPNTDTCSISGTDGHLGGQANITKDQAMAQILLSDFLKVLGRCPRYGKCSSVDRFRPTRMLTGTVVHATAGDALD